VITEFFRLGFCSARARGAHLPFQRRAIRWTRGCRSWLRSCPPQPAPSRHHLCVLHKV